MVVGSRSSRGSMWSCIQGMASSKSDAFLIRHVVLESIKKQVAIVRTSTQFQAIWKVCVVKVGGLQAPRHLLCRR
jgi:hypothetical protein